MYRKFSILFIVLLSFIVLTACSYFDVNTFENTTVIQFNEDGIFLDDTEITRDTSQPIYIANDIIYYEDGHDFTYGKGYGDDLHSKEEADANIVVHITKPGKYELTGKLDKGQIAIDLGKESKNDPNAVVTLVLNNIDITCDVAPAIIFYNVYEPFDDVTEKTAKKDVNTDTAGAYIIIADDSVNNINGSYVARIYKPESVVLNESGNKVIEEKKLHKYDAALYSKMTMNVDSGVKDTGVLNIVAENEGLDTEMHLTINGGTININSVNDGINVNEDDISVVTINGGRLNIKVSGNLQEGDGIDSNGWLIINDGIVIAQSCDFGIDSGIDGNKGIYINKGTVIAAGNDLKEVYRKDKRQSHLIFNKTDGLPSGTYILKNSKDKIVLKFEIDKVYTILLVSSNNLELDSYTLWCNNKQIGNPFDMQKGENHIDIE